MISDSLQISGNPSTLIIAATKAGQQPSIARDTSTTYKISTSNGSKSYTTVSGSLGTNMPSHVTLSVKLAAPSGAISAGLVSMSTIGKNLVTSIPNKTKGSNLTITYSLAATAAAAQCSNSTTTLTLTLQ